MFLQVATSVCGRCGVGNAGWARADGRLGANPSLPPQGPSEERTPPELRNKTPEALLKFSKNVKTFIYRVKYNFLKNPNPNQTPTLIRGIIIE